MKGWLIGLGVLCLLLGGYAQSVEWSRLYVQSSARGFLPQVAATDSQGSLIVAGRYLRTSGHYSVALFKYSPRGDLLWATTFGTEGQSDYAEAIAVAPDDSLYLAVTRADRDSIAYVQRYSPAGTLLWSQAVNLSAYDVIQQLVVRPDGGVEALLAYGNSGMGYARLIYDSAGNQLAAHTFPQPATWMAYRFPVGMLPIDSVNRLLVVMDPEIDDVLQSQCHTRLQFLNSAGMLVGETSLPMRVARFARASDGTFYLLGDYWNTSAQQMRLRVVRVDSDLQVLGQWEISTADGDSIPDVLVVNGTRWLVSGSVEGASASGTAVEVRSQEGTLLTSQALTGAYRPFAGVGVPGAFALLVGVRQSSPEAWKPQIYWYRTDGQPMGVLNLPPLSAIDEQPELLVPSPDGALYAIATVNRESDNMACAGIWRVRGLPTLSGRVILESFVGDPSTHVAQFTLTDGSQTDSVSVPLGANGEYALTTLLTGNLQIRAYVPGWLGKRQTLTLTGSATADWSLINGDANRDNQIDDADLLIVLFSFGQSGANPADLNGDGTVDDADLLIVLFNFGTIGD